ncbi:unnamed protein product [Phytophthora fragariaefolia]|uniref:Unnamed protein product n=1 Tax=Phytophthora fragariaefolia TaxID=1490495 RepID=A0A9W7D4Y3_9STRA|nr:unnamed protein product [Phytophthora fragariaefolia]
MKFLEFYFANRENLGDKILLLWDDLSAHWTLEVKLYAKSLNVVLLKVPPRYTAACHPADISWNKPFKGLLRRLWSLVGPSRPIMTDWITSSWGALSEKTIRNGFARVGLLLDTREAAVDDNVEVNTENLIACLENYNLAEAEVNSDDDIETNSSGSHSEDDDL